MTSYKRNIGESTISNIFICHSHVFFINFSDKFRIWKIHSSFKKTKICHLILAQEQMNKMEIVAVKLWTPNHYNHNDIKDDNIHTNEV